MTIVSDTVLCLELKPGHGVPLYLADHNGKTEILHRRWSKGLRWSAAEWQRLLDVARTPMDMTGRVVHWPVGAVTWRRGAREAEVLAEFGPELAIVADALSLDVDSIGVCGSSLYKAAVDRSDFDFVVAEQPGDLSIADTVRRLAGDCRIGNVPYHVRFRLPGIGWCDPHVTAPCTLVDAIITGQAERVGTGVLRGQRVVDDSHGHHYPAHYVLAGGKHLVSFRFGHSALLRTGDYVRSVDTAPLFRWGGVTSCVITDGHHYLEGKPV
ncbi:hypothetical protein ACFORH_39215 [Amycolatopsis roodepoortensis]|uniref:Polymerase nucleotidyl transferase domain-containing protein n=1 Tax=Amycolatopsis roodepoortensis TaxID=700274 RepID=A0ABR9LIR2_9PSEU|nr:hypothetical protein [Amycolatopsis roodepoortensis]MBE1580548.1 hypothetical protein [Amycolatopsis roodepoortensis]